MIDASLLNRVQHSLCCPDGLCRALGEGDPKSCGAPYTKKHAEAAIEIVQGDYRSQTKALIDIQREAKRLAESSDNVQHSDFSRIAKLAAEALK